MLKEKKSISRYLNHQLSVLVSVLESYIGRALDSMDIKKNGAQIFTIGANTNIFRHKQIL